METTEEGGSKPKIAPKRIKLQEILEGEDRISALPDCLLLEILYRLHSTKGAIRAGTLSKRWQHLWTLVPSLILLDDRRSDFVSSVDKTLTQCRQLKLKKFIVHTGHDIRFESQVNNWVRYAIKCNVEELSLTFWDAEFVADFQLRQILFTSSCFTDLILEGCLLDPIGAISWKNIRSLCISFVELDEDLIENILCGSPQLETFVLNNCYGYGRLDITSKSVKNLVFSECYNSGDESDVHIVEINAPHILSLTIRDELVLWKVLVVNVSSLVKAKLDYRNGDSTTKEEEEEMLKGLMLNLSHVKELVLGGFCCKVLSRLVAKGSIFPSNLKRPDIVFDSCSDDDSLEVGDSSDDENGFWEVVMLDSMML